MSWLDKIKNNIVFIMAAIGGILLFFLGRKSDVIANLKTTLGLASTKEKVQNIQNKIDNLSKDLVESKNKNSELDKKLEDLDSKQSKVEASQKDKSPGEVEEFWSKR